MLIPGCTIVAIRNGENYLLASNSDNPWDTRTRVRVVEGDKGRFVGTELICPDDNLPWSSMITRGINDRGIAFTFAYVDCSPEFYQGGIGFKEFGHHILSGFQSLQEIEHYLRHEPVQTHGNFLFADDQGNLLVSEIHPKKKHFQWNPDTVVIRTNHFMNLPFVNDKEVAETCSILRYQSGMHRLSEGKREGAVEFLQALLCNHHLQEHTSAWGSSTCNHGDAVGTVSSEILDPLNKEIFYCYGPPCGEGGDMQAWGKYVSFQLSGWSEGELTTINGEILSKGVKSC
ncbi:carcinine hydrolase/isopenicillin-N N-acyltransferase family protein [Aneurinibacillus sp. Ricciae_BoGa-3]|uniref:carcinine hydrolase/isopenicillin-N N-acyltransferase family protein n=1 Tax=Aneurinibacillus sp. Ricciae_BoGa-3 TaxID=3022697 RepID=UPI0023404CBE|nr:carcinine hydrolase/isopenicillin-N N-acyltransferase family protein [Aneurinibacillus sp. Ricciae_BoGa-3]WCK55170.1 carcinine hydrolase/isopenicillin-N N-acyltransferase family protein [Aneurinibacillus sp. Ricciae_BoGa-3]